jgi:hypothetical protein
MSSTSVRLIVGYAAIVGTLPYLALKAAWLSGSTIGLTDPTAAHDGSLFALNLITAGMDVIAILVALAFTYRWGERLPAWLVLFPMWVAAGFLAPIVVAMPTLALSTPDSNGFLEPWVQPMVYTGFAWQGLTLMIAFALHARVRWPAAFSGPTAVPAPAGYLLAGLALAVAVADLVAAVGGGVGLLVTGLMALGAAAGILLLTRAVAGRLPVALTFVGSGALFSWGAWGLLNALGHTVLSGGSAPRDLASVVAGLGIALAVVRYVPGRSTKSRPARYAPEVALP